MAALSFLLHALKRHAVTRFALSAVLSLTILPSCTPARAQGLPVVVPGTLAQASTSSGACFTLHQCGDGGPLSAASFVQPDDMAFDGSGNLFIVDASDVRVRKVTKGAGPLRDGIVRPFAGQSRTKCPSPTAPCGDGGLVSDPSVLLNGPRSIAFNAAGDLFIADFDDNRVRRVDHATSIITTYAGNGDTGFLNPVSIEGLPAKQVGIQPKEVALAPDGTLYIANGVSDGPILAVDPTTGHIRTYAGSASGCTGCDNVQAIQANIGWPSGMSVDENGDLYFVDISNHVVRKVTKSTGLITTIAGAGSNLPYNTVQLAKDTEFVSPEDLLILPSGDLLVDDSGVGAGQIFRVEMSTGLLYPIAGCSGLVNTCDTTSTVATRGRIDTLRMTIDAQGNIFYTSQAVEQPIYEVENRPATITFADTAVNIRSRDSPQTAYLMNFGAAALQLAAGTPGVPFTYTPLLTTTTSGADNSFTLDAASTAADTYTTACPAPAATPSAIAPGTTCRFNLVFQPTAAGTITGQLSIAYGGTNRVGAEQIIPLNGSTTSATPTASATVAAQTITYGTASVSLSASLTYSETAPSGAATFKVNDGAAVTGTCTGAASPLTCTARYVTSALAPGSYTIAFHVAADSTYTVTVASGTLTVNKATATVTLGSLTATYDGNPHVATVVTAPADLTVSVTYDGAAAAPTAAGSYAVLATVTDANYTGSRTGTLVISGGPTTPTITFAVPAHTFGDADFTVNATSSSPGALTYSLVSGPATLSGTTVHLTGVGSVTLQASQAASDTYSATTKTATFSVAKAAATATLGSLTATYDGNPHAATVVTSPAGLSNSVTYDGAATVPTAAGSYAVLATVTDANYTGSKAGTLVISGQTPNITFVVPAHTFGDADFTAAATSNSPGALTYSIVSGPATLSGTTVHLTGAGSVTLQASQAASGTYSANSKTAIFAVARASATLNLGSLTATYDGNQHAATVVTSPAGLSVSVTYNGSTTAPSATGYYAVSAGVTDPNYTGFATGTLVISAQTAPIITFVVPARSFGDADFNIGAQSSSPGAITYRVVSGPAILSGTTVHVIGAGSITFEASQVAGGSYTAATKTATTTVAMATPSIRWPTPGAVAYATPLGPAQLNATATGVGGAALPGSFTYTPPAASAAVQVPAQTLQVVFTPVDTANYTAATASVSLPVSSAVLVVTANAATRPYGTANPSLSGTITGQQNGDTFTETFSTNATPSSNAGTYAIVPAAVGPNLGRYTQQIHGATLTITRAPVQITAVSSVASSAAGQSVTLTATVLSTTTGIPTGTVQFFDNGNPIGTAALVGTQATVTSSVTRAGTNLLSLAYSGDINFLPLTNTGQTFTGGSQDFTLTLLSSPTSSFHVGESGTYQLRVAPLKGYILADDVNLSYSADLPSYAVGQFSAVKVDAGSESTDLTFSVVTTKRAMNENLAFRAAEIAVALLIPLGLLRRRKLLRGASLFATMVALLFISATLSGCSTRYTYIGGTVPIVVKAQSNDGIVHTLTIEAKVLQTGQ